MGSISFEEGRKWKIRFSWVGQLIEFPPSKENHLKDFWANLPLRSGTSPSRIALELRDG